MLLTSLVTSKTTLPVLVSTFIKVENSQKMAYFIWKALLLMTTVSTYPPNHMEETTTVRDPLPIAIEPFTARGPRTKCWADNKFENRSESSSVRFVDPWSHHRINKWKLQITTTLNFTITTSNIMTTINNTIQPAGKTGKLPIHIHKQQIAVSKVSVFQNIELQAFWRRQPIVNIVIANFKNLKK